MDTAVNQWTAYVVAVPFVAMYLWAALCPIGRKHPPGVTVNRK
jgi:hypothetical protein